MGGMGEKLQFLPSREVGDAASLKREEQKNRNKEFVWIALGMIVNVDYVHDNFHDGNKDRRTFLNPWC